MSSHLPPDLHFEDSQPLLCKPDFITCCRTVLSTAGKGEILRIFQIWWQDKMDKTRAVRGIAGRKKSETKSLRLESQPIYPEPVYKNSSIGQTKALMTELKRQNFHGAFCVEYEYHWENSQPEIAECVKFFNATCDELVAAGAK